jgi:hypothetical protein
MSCVYVCVQTVWPYDPSEEQDGDRCAAEGGGGGAGGRGGEGRKGSGCGSQGGGKSVVTDLRASASDQSVMLYLMLDMLPLLLVPAVAYADVYL